MGLLNPQTGAGLLGGFERGLYRGMDMAEKRRQQDALAAYKNALMGAKKGSGGTHTMGSLGLVPEGDVNFYLPVPEEKAPGLILQSQSQSKPGADAAKDVGKYEFVTGELANLGALGKEMGDSYLASKNPVKSVIADIGTPLMRKFPATAGALDPVKAKYIGQAQHVLDTIGRSDSGGAINNEEWIGFRQFIPMESDYAAGPGAVKNKLRQITNAYKIKAQTAASSIANPVTKKKYLDDIETRAKDIQAQLEAGFLGTGKSNDLEAKKKRLAELEAKAATPAPGLLNQMDENGVPPPGF
jgi:hypothetical protein